MKPQHLIQAFSRTNRIFNKVKRYGQIVTLQTIVDAKPHRTGLFRSGITAHAIDDPGAGSGEAAELPVLRRATAR